MDNIEGIGATIHQMHMAAEREDMRNAELTRLRAELATVKQQHDELKEAAATLSADVTTIGQQRNELLAALEEIPLGVALREDDPVIVAAKAAIAKVKE